MVSVKADYWVGRSPGDTYKKVREEIGILVGVYTVLMLLYTAIMLRKFTLSLVGVGIILAALFSSTATMFYFNIQST